MAFILQEHLAAAIEERYPGIRRWEDYWVANPCTDKGVHIGDAFIAGWVAGPPPDVAPLLKRAAELAPVFDERDARLDRDQLLLQSDWAVQPDAPTDQAAWRAYRKALRDLPEQPGWPDVTWPVKP